MADNKKMQEAKRQKNDEFYTEYSTISDEMGHYREQLAGQVIYCNCDDPVQSNFWRYFHNNFASLKLEKLISTHYRKDAEPSYAMIYEGGDDFNMNAGMVVTISGDGDYNAGDFRSADCIEFLEEATVVITNPPFSLFREYVAQLMKYEKKFLIIGNQNAITYKEIFPLIMTNRMWLGYYSGDMKFRVPDYYEPRPTRFWIDETGQKWRSLGNVCWYTNLDVKRRHDGLWHKNGKFDNTQAHRYYEGNEDRYPQYDNYNAINVDATKNIPIDYAGVMGVPITWLDKYSLEEFEILDARDFAKYDRQRNKTTFLIKDADGLVNGIRKYARILIRNRHPVSKANDRGY